MTMRSIRHAAVLGAVASLAVALAACTRDPGPQVSRQREVEPFRTIELQGAADVDVLVGERQSVVVDGPEEAADALAVAVRDGRLHLETRGAWRWRDTHLKIRITVPALDGFELKGAGHVSVIGPSGGALAVVLSGAGDIEASGRVDHLTARVNGAGSVDLSRLEATDADVTVNGAGSLEVNASERLNATLNGVGSIDYVGKPTHLETAIHGVGSIGPRRRP